MLIAEIQLSISFCQEKIQPTDVRLFYLYGDNLKTSFGIMSFIQLYALRCSIRKVEFKLTDIDKKIGAKIKRLRKGQGISQIELAEKIGISFQQIQKYEKGVTKMPVFRLRQISEALNVNAAIFFKEEDPAFQVSGPVVKYGQEERADDKDQFLDKQDMIILSLFRKISNKKVKEGFLKQLRGIVELEKRP